MDKVRKLKDKIEELDPKNNSKKLKPKAKKKIGEPKKKNKYYWLNQNEEE